MELKYDFLNKMNTLNSISKNNGYINFRDWAYKQNQLKLINSIEFSEIELFHNIRNIISHGAADRVIVYQSDIEKLDKYIKLLNKSLGYSSIEDEINDDNKQEESKIFVNEKKVVKEKDPNNVAHKKDIIKYIEQLKDEAKLKGLSTLTLIAREVEKQMGLNQRIVSICSAMYECMRDKDEVLHTVPSGYSTTVEVKYYL